MSSDIQEVSNLKEILCRKKVSEIRKKYYKAEKRVCLIKSILDKNDIIWALHKEYLECRKDCTCPEVITIVIGQQYQNIVLNIFNMLGTIENGQIFVINNVRIRLAFNFILENNICNLTNNNIRYCILEDESLPILTP